MSQVTTEKRDEYYARLAPRNLSPLWEVLDALLPPEPKSKAVANIWRYKELRPLLLEAGALLTAEEAERRVLVLENPSYPGQSRATSTLYAGLQLIMPGETAPAHRHTPSAMRLMIEGSGAFTAVGGERTIMHEGDFVITPSWAFHDHGNDGDEACIWLDGLDVPITGFLEAVFREDHNDVRQNIVRPNGDSLARFGSGLLPMQATSRFGLTTPIFNHPYVRTREALIAASKGEDPDPHHATTLRFANPIDGGWPMPTISAWVMYIPKGMETAPVRTTDALVVSVIEGSGTIKVGDKEFDFEPKDTIAVPGWAWRQFAAREDCVVFCISDRVVHEKLGLFREELADIR